MVISRKIVLIALVLSSACLLLGCPSGDGRSTNRGGGSGGEPDVSSSDGDGTSASNGAAATDGGEVEILDGWGHLKGRFTLTGAPAAAPITVTQDAAFCGKFGLVDEKFTVGPGGGLANVVVFLYLEKDQQPPEPHESYAENAEAEIVLNNKNCRFDPHVVLIRTTQELIAKNSDTVGHNTKIDYNPAPINPSIPPGAQIEKTFPDVPRRGVAVQVGCSSHPWMRAWLIIRQSPYMAVSDENGNFEIKNLPAGKWTFQFWHEGLGYVRKVTVGGKSADWKKGQHEVAIVGADKTTDLGEVKLKMADYPQN